MNFNQFLKQAQSMQKKMQDTQEQMALKEYIGQSGGGLISVAITGQKNVKKITIDKSLLIPDEVDVLEDLLVAALNDAKNKADKDSEDSMGQLLGGMPLPPGFKMPF
jgi:DNA-binding YbaB/EbfC family protein